MSLVLRFALPEARNLFVSSVGNFRAGILDVNANDAVAIGRARFKLPPFGAIEIGFVDSSDPAPVLPAAPAAPAPDPYPQYVTADELTAALNGGGGGSVADATAITKGKIRLAGDLGGTADSPTVPGLGTKVNSSTFTTALSGKADTASLATVATTGAYGDLVGKPTIPAPTTDASALTAGTLPPARIADGSVTDVKLTSGTALSAAERTKLASVAAGATVNAADPALRDRSTHTGTQPASTISDFAAAVQSAGGGGSGSGALPVNSRTAMAKLHAIAAGRNEKPIYVVACGDSWTFGTGAGGNGFRYIDRLHTRLQAEWPLDTGTAGGVGYLGNLGTVTNGVRVVGNGHPGATTFNYLPTSEVTAIAAINPSVILHAPGLNDQGQQIPVSTSKANLLAAIRALDAAITVPHVHVLVRMPALSRPTNPVLWSAWGDALAQVAAADPSNIVYIDVAAVWAQVGFTQMGGTDPLVLGDNAHPNGRGHAFLGDTIFAAIRPVVAVGLSAYSVSTPVVSNTAGPVVTGTPSEGNTVTGTNGTYNPTPDTYSHQWFRAGVAIAGATSPSYLLTSADAGKQLTLVVTADKSGHISGAASVTVAVAAATAVTNSVSPAVTGTATTGQTLTTSTGTWSPTPDSYTYQWQRAGVAISGATANTYVLQVADEGQAVTCVVTAIKATYTSGTASSNTVTPTAAGAPALTNSSVPTITGTPTEGQTLTAGNGAWSATPDSYTYVWKRAGSAISGATASTYVLTSGDVGSAITVTVTAVKAGYTSGTATSAATAAVTAAGSGTTTTTESWTGTTGASWPADWTVSGATATIQNNKGRLDPSGTWSVAARSSMAAFTGDFDTMVTYRATGNTSVCNIAVGAGAGVNSGSIRPTNGYFAECTTNAAGTLSPINLYKQSANANTFLGVAYPALTPGTDGFTVRVQRLGSVIRTKVWVAGTAEPAAWGVSVTDSTPLTAALKGWLGAQDPSGATVTDFAAYAITA